MDVFSAERSGSVTLPSLISRRATLPRTDQVIPHSHLALSCLAGLAPDQHGALLIGGRCFKIGPSRGLGFKPAVAQPKDVIEPIEDHFVMRDADDRGILFDGDPPQQVHHDPGALRVQRRRRLIGENDAGPVGKRAGNRDALPLAAGQLNPASCSTTATLSVASRNGSSSLGRDVDRISMVLNSERSQSWLLTTISGKSLA